MLGESHLPGASYFEILYYFPIQLQGTIYVNIPENTKVHSGRDIPLALG